MRRAGSRPVEDNRVSPDLPARLVFTETEITVLEKLVPTNGSRKRTVGNFLIPARKTRSPLNKPNRRCAAWDREALALRPPDTPSWGRAASWITQLMRMWQRRAHLIASVVTTEGLKPMRLVKPDYGTEVG
jgi:hypothetical protein